MAGKPQLHLTCTVSPIEVRGAALLLEFRHIDQQIKIAREERLLEQQQANRELIRSLAHEIKNPLGGIRGAAQLLERELDRPQLIEYTQVIIGEADRLQSLVNRLLTPHRAADVPPHQHPRNAGARQRRRAGRVSRTSRSYRDFDTSLPEFEADPEQLTQAMLNIVRNAAQAVAATTAGREIRMTTRIARGVTLAGKRHRLAVASSIERQRSGRSRGICASGSSIRWSPAARAARAWGSRSRKRSSRSTTARSNARACRGERCSRSCCRWNRPRRRITNG